MQPGSTSFLRYWNGEYGGGTVPVIHYYKYISGNLKSMNQLVELYLRIADDTDDRMRYRSFTNSHSTPEIFTISGYIAAIPTYTDRPTTIRAPLFHQTPRAAIGSLIEYLMRQAEKHLRNYCMPIMQLLCRQRLTLPWRQNPHSSKHATTAISSLNLPEISLREEENRRLNRMPDGTEKQLERARITQRRNSYRLRMSP